MDLKKIKDLIKKKPTVASISGVFVFIIMGLLLMPSKSQKLTGSPSRKPHPSTDIGISVGGADQQALLALLKDNYSDFEERMKEMESRVKNIQAQTQDLKNSQQSMDQDLSLKVNQKLDELKTDFRSFQELQENSVNEEVELSVADINSTAEEDWVYLPIGSFCQGTLLTGVYATSDASNPLPVLISLDEAFYGPNKTRIPLKGAFVLGKATGDLVSQRALIQIVAISTVLPDSHTFESEQDLGYVTDESGELGIKGQVVYNTGRQLALGFLGGFVSGGAQAIADAQVTTHKTLQGDTSKDVTGSPSKNALFSGLAQSAGKLADFYSKQAQDLVPAVHINNGVKVFFIVQKGVTINGLAKSNFIHQHYMD